LSVIVLSAGFGCRGMLSQSAEHASLPPVPHAKQIHLKHVLVIGQTKGFEHDSISAAMAAIYNMGKESGLWETTLRTDTELLTKKDLGRNTRNLGYFDLIVFTSTTGELDMDAAQKQDMLSFIKEDGKGFVGIHAALDTNYNWPEYGEMIGGWFDQHPWSTFNAPILNEDPDLRDLSAKSVVTRQGQRLAEPRSKSARLRQQSEGSSHRPRLRSCLDQNVRQGPCLLLHLGTHRGSVGRPRHTQDVFRSDTLGSLDD
jgi:hypothetical protein